MIVRCEVERRGTLDVSAASGVLLIDGTLWVVADDDGALHRFDLDGRRIDALPLGLPSPPADHAERKRTKADFECLLDLGDGRIAALGSGSTSARHRGKLVVRASFRVHDVDLAPLHGALARTITDLNLEGGVFHADACVLAQRGNGASRRSALVFLDAQRVRDGFDLGALPASVIRSVVEVDLGALDGVPLSLTDLAVDPHGRLWFSAAAEDTTSTYDDGACIGSVIGVFDDACAVAWSMRLEGRDKIEGICFAGGTETPERGYLVADPDDPEARAPLMTFGIFED